MRSRWLVVAMWPGIAWADPEPPAISEPPPIVEPAPPGEPPSPGEPLPMPTWQPVRGRRAEAGTSIQKAGGYVAGTGAAIVVAGGIAGLVSAATVGPCDGNGNCGQEGVLGRVVVPIVCATGAAIGVSGVIMRVVGGRMQPARPGFAMVLPTWSRDGGGIVAVGRF